MQLVVEDSLFGHADVVLGFVFKVATVRGR